MESLALIRDIAALIASIVVLLGVNAWRRDFVGKREIELAEEVLGLFYRARDAIAHMRSPMAYSTESDHIVAVAGESEDRAHARRTVAPLYKRYEDYSELFAEIHATRYQFMARFGIANGKPFHDLQKTLREVFTAAEMMMITAGDYRNPDGQQRWISYTEKIWSHGTEDDITSKVDAAVEEIEDICRRKISKQSLVGLAYLKLCGWLEKQQIYRAVRKWLLS